MKAVFLEKHGGNEVLSYGDRPDPSPKPGEVLVHLEAAALNRLDVFVRDGIPGVPVTFPHVPGADGAGVVEAVAAGRVESAVEASLKAGETKADLGGSLSTVASADADLARI